MVLLLIAIGFLACKQTAIIRESPQVIYSFIQLMIKLPAALAIICFVFCTNRWINYRYFLWVGILSYEIYLIHGYTINIYNTGMPMIHIVLVFSGLTFALSRECIVSIHIYQVNCGKYYYIKQKIEGISKYGFIL